MWIVFEGMDGTGKTTQIKNCSNYLTQRNIQNIIVREPGGTKIGEKIRKLIFEHGEIHVNTELLLFFASRIELLDKVIIPALKKNIVVLSDRFIDSSFIYQGYVKNASSKLLDSLSEFCLKDFSPDRIYIFHKKVQQNFKSDRFEKENNDFHAKIQEGYLKQIHKNNAYKLINSSLSHEVVLNNLIQDINALLLSSQTLSINLKL